MTKETVEFFRYKDQIIVLTWLKHAYAMHGGNTSHRHVVLLTNKEGEQTYISCLDFEAGGAVFDNDYFIESDGYLLLKTDLARKIDREAEKDSNDLAYKINKYFTKDIEMVEVYL